MGVWAGPDWPEAGLRTKPPGSPYLGPQRRAAPRCPLRHPGPATPSPRGPSPGRRAAVDPLPAREQRPFGTMGPLPRLEAGRYKGREARPGTEPGVRKVPAEEGEGKGGDGGGRGSPRPLPRPAEALPGAPPPRQRRERRPAAFQPRDDRVCTQRGAGPPTSARAGDRPTRPARRRSAAPVQPAPLAGRVRAGRPSPRLTHSSVPQLMVELDATRAVWLPRCPSVGSAVSLSDLALADRRARGCAALPPKVPPQPGSPVSEKESTGEAAAASPPPGAGREGARAEGRRDPERGGGGGRGAVHPGIGADPRSPGRSGQGRLAGKSATGPVLCRVPSRPLPGVSDSPTAAARISVQDGKGARQKTPTALLLEPP